MNIELQQIVLWITVPAVLICLICIFLISTVREKGKVYTVDGKYLHNHGMLHQVFPKKICLIDIDEVVIYHSWLEPSGANQARDTLVEALKRYSVKCRCWTN